LSNDDQIELIPTPTKKSNEINKVLSKIAGTPREEAITERRCTLCGKPAVSFDDALSEKEFKISGLCQLCQDEMFNHTPRKLK
jgi:CRISPR/Cas system-associated protein Cas10 (large subunit of type III CRISPR-Cas system)